MATLQDVTIFRGEDAILNVTLDPVLDVTGWSISLFIRQRAELGSSYLLTAAATITSAIEGKFTISLLGTDTVNLPCRRYRYDIWRTGAGVQTLLTYGALDVLPQARFTPLS